MDYKKTYFNTYQPILKRQEKKAKDLLLTFKEQKRKYNSASSKVGSILFNDLKNHEQIAPFNIHYQALDFIQKKDEYYSEDSLELILQNEIKDSFDEGVDLGFSSYDLFIGNLATYKALDDSRRNFGNQNWLVDLYYEYGEIDKLKLDYSEDVRNHPDYIRLTKKKYPNLKPIDPNQEFDIDAFGNINIKKKAQEIILDEKSKESNRPYSILESIENLKLKNEEKTKALKAANLISDFTKDEKLVLLGTIFNMHHAFRDEIHASDMQRLLYICHDVFDIRIFVKLPSHITEYKKFKMGLTYYEIDQQLILRQNIKEKLTALKMKSLLNVFLDLN